MFTVNGTDARQGRAREKARALRPAVIAHKASSYRVEGSGGNFYAVTVEGAEVGCSCMAGQNDKPCYHAFAALRTRALLAQAPASAIAPRDRHLDNVEKDLRFIMRAVEGISGNYEAVEAIFRAARAAQNSLAEYELGLLPEVIDCAA
jgi:hypothetical protein